MMTKRILKAEIILPEEDGGVSITFGEGDDDMYIKMSVQKTILVTQNSCTVEIIGMSPEIRQRLLTQFTAWNYRKAPTKRYAAIRIWAAHDKANSTSNPMMVFKGDIVRCEPSGNVPNLAIVIEALTNQVDRSKMFPVDIPTKATYKMIATEVARAAGLSLDMKTAYADQEVENFGVFRLNPVGAPYFSTVEAAIVLLNTIWKDKTFVWVDDDTIHIRDKYTADFSSVEKVNLFIDAPPVWTEWGIKFKTMFNPKIKLAGAIELDSKINPISGQFVVMRINYELASKRASPFYMTVTAAPPAQ